MLQVRGKMWVGWQGTGESEWIREMWFDFRAVSGFQLRFMVMMLSETRQWLCVSPGAFSWKGAGTAWAGLD